MKSKQKVVAHLLTQRQKIKINERVKITENGCTGKTVAGRKLKESEKRKIGKITVFCALR